MWNLFKKKPIPDYQSELEWKYPDRPVVMSWTRWAIPRSNLQTSIIFTAFFAGACVMWALLYGALMKGQEFGFYWDKLFYSSIPGAIFLACMCGMAFEHRFYVYRITEQGLEVYSWLEAYKKAVLLIKITLVAAGIALVVVAIHTGSIAVFFGALIGPAGYGLLGLTSMTSENFEKVNRNFDHDERVWDTIVRRIFVDYRRKIISIERLNYCKEQDFTIMGTFPIFCDKEKFDEILAFVKKKHPDAPYISQSMREMSKYYDGKPQTDEPFNYIEAPISPNKDKTSLW